MNNYDDSNQKGPFDDDEFEKYLRRLVDRIISDDDFQSFMSNFMGDPSKMFSESEPGKPFIHGFKVDFDESGRPKISNLNKMMDVKKKRVIHPSKRISSPDVIESEEYISVTLELFDVEEEDISIDVQESRLEISVNGPERKFKRVVNLPDSVDPEAMVSTYRNGILDVSIAKKKLSSE